MFEVGIYEAKTNLPAILRRVENGEDCVITRRGKPVATINHFSETKDDQVAAFWKCLGEIRRKKSKTPLWKEIYDLRHEGHKW